MARTVGADRNLSVFRYHLYRSLESEQVNLTLRQGLLVNSIEVDGNPAGRLLFSRRDRNQADELSRRLKIGRSTIECSQDLNSALTPG